MDDQWYTAKCLYKAVHTGGEPPSEELSEPRFFIVRSPDDLTAMEKALALAKEREHSYENEFGATIQWTLQGVLDVKEIFDFSVKDGLEVYHEYC